MKRTLLTRLCAALLALMLLFSSALAAPLFDPDDYSDEELLEIYAQVREAIRRRGLEDILVLAEGFYIAGEDFPAGSYRVTVTAPCTGTEYGYLALTEGDYPVEEYEIPLEDQDTAVSLTDGQTIVVLGTLTLYPQ